MSAHTKKHPTKKTLLQAEDGRTFEVPNSTLLELKKYLLRPVSTADAFGDLNKKYSKAGALLKGLRSRESLNQTSFGELFNITQGDLSKMERGELPLGKERAKKIASYFDIDYRNLL